MATKEKMKPGLMIYHDDYMAVFDSLNNEEAGAATVPRRYFMNGVGSSFPSCQLC